MKYHGQRFFFLLFYVGIFLIPIFHFLLRKILGAVEFLIFFTHFWTNLVSWCSFFINPSQFIKSLVRHKNLKDFNTWVTTVMEWILVADIKRCSRLWQGFIVLQSYCSCPGKCIIEGCESVSLSENHFKDGVEGGRGSVFRKIALIPILLLL